MASAPSACTAAVDRFRSEKIVAAAVVPPAADPVAMRVLRIPASLTSTVLRMLSTDFPLSRYGLTHLKRVSKTAPSTSTPPPPGLPTVYVLICPLSHSDSRAAVEKVWAVSSDRWSGPPGGLEIVEEERMLPMVAPKTASEWQPWVGYWPVSPTHISAPPHWTLLEDSVLVGNETANAYRTLRRTQHLNTADEKSHPELLGEEARETIWTTISSRLQPYLEAAISVALDLDGSALHRPESLHDRRLRDAVGTVVVDPSSGDVIAKARAAIHPFRSPYGCGRREERNGNDSDRYGSSSPLGHSLLLALSGASSAWTDGPDPSRYLCTGLDVYTTHEPCVMCTMAAVHSRVRRLYYIVPMVRTIGACESHWRVPSCETLNHHPAAFRVSGTTGPYQWSELLDENFTGESA